MNRNVLTYISNKGKEQVYRQKNENKFSFDEAFTIEIIT